VKNLTDTRYWAYSSSTVIPGEPRTVVAGVHFGF
jgi:outer membrane receptor protein involved in Fe transport